MTEFECRVVECVHELLARVYRWDASTPRGVNVKVGGADVFPFVGREEQAREAIRRGMRERGVTNAELAEALGVSERTVNRWKKNPALISVKSVDDAHTLLPELLVCLTEPASAMVDRFELTRKRRVRAMTAGILLDALPYEMQDAFMVQLQSTVLALHSHGGKVDRDELLADLERGALAFADCDQTCDDFTEEDARDLAARLADALTE